MSKEIEEIRARHEAGPIGMLPMQALAVAEDDRAFLLAEVERLSLALQTIRDQGGDVVERWSSEVARRALEDRR